MGLLGLFTLAGEYLKIGALNVIIENLVGVSKTRRMARWEPREDLNPFRTF
jgi:hypothetical protein